MVDKYKITDTLRSWRVRNGVDVPQEFLNALEKNNAQIGVLIVALVIMSFFIGMIV